MKKYVVIVITRKIIVFFFFLHVRATEFVRDYTNAANRIINYNNPNCVMKNVLKSYDNNNNSLLICYVGQGPIHGCINHGNAFTKKPKNLLGEVHLYNKVEKRLYLKEIDNEHSVTAILAQKGVYFIAHQQSVYICGKSKLPLSSALLLYCTLKHVCTGGDTVKKMYLSQQNSLIIVSKKGSILRYNDAFSHSNDAGKQILITLSPLVTPSDDPVYCVRYDVAKNVLLLGSNGIVKYYRFDTNKIGSRIIKMPQKLKINTIDSNGTHLLFSDARQKQMNDDDYNYMHNSEQNCCKKYAKGIECEECSKKIQEWQKRKEEWENKDITIKRYQINNFLRKEYSEKEPVCLHKTYSDHYLSDSCECKTIFFSTFDDIVTNSCNMITKEIHDYCYDTYDAKEKIVLIKKLFLTDSFLCVQYSNNLGKHNDYIFKYRLSDIDQNSTHTINLDHSYSSIFGPNTESYGTRTGFVSGGDDAISPINLLYDLHKPDSPTSNEEHRSLDFFVDTEHNKNEIIILKLFWRDAYFQLHDVIRLSKADNTFVIHKLNSIQLWCSRKIAIFVAIIRQVYYSFFK